MTAMASPRGRPPLQPPPPPQKPMPAGQRKGGRGSCLGLSCFGGFPVADLDARQPAGPGRRAPWFNWSRFRKKKKTVPVDASATELLSEKALSVDDRPSHMAGEDDSAGKGGHGDKEEESGKHDQLHVAPSKTLPAPPAAAAAAVELPSQSFFWRLRKGNKDRGASKTEQLQKDQHSASNHKKKLLQQQQRRRPPPPQQPRLPSISTKYDTRRATSFPAPPEPARTIPTNTGTPRTALPHAAASSPPSSSPAASPARSKPPPTHAAVASRLGGTRPPKKWEHASASSSAALPAGRNDQVLGLSVMAIVLVMMLLFGRVSAVVFTCLWFYCLPRLRTTMAEASVGGGGSSTKVDFVSEEYKKKVVLEGLLQRDGRRPPGSSQAA